MGLTGPCETASDSEGLPGAALRGRPLIMNSGRFPTVTVTGAVPIDPIRGHLAPADPRDAERSPDLEPWAPRT